MKLVQLSLIVAFALTLMTPLVSMAAADPAAGTKANLDTAAPAELRGTTTKSLPAYIGAVVKGLLQLLGAVFLLLVLYGGWLWMTAQGETAQVSKAKNIITGAIIGLIVIAGSYAITNFVFSTILPS